MTVRMSFTDWHRHCRAEVDRRAWAMGITASKVSQLRGEVARLELRIINRSAAHPAGHTPAGGMTPQAASVPLAPSAAGRCTQDPRS